MIKHCSTKLINRLINQRDSGFTQGFTLIELLVVISIISILAGAMFMVINPAQMQRKAKEAVLKAKTSQICLALNACGSAKDDARLCDTLAEIGSSNPDGDPPTAVYRLDATLPLSANSTITETGTLGTCIYTCNFNFNDGSSLKLTGVGICL